MMDKFQECFFENELSVLIIEGIPTPEELQAVWDKIYTQYCQLSQDGSYNEVFEIQKEILNLKIKINLVDGIVKHLRINYDEELVNILNEFTLRCKLKPEDAQNVVDAKLNQVIGRAKKWLIRLKQRQGDLNKVRSNNTAKVDTNYFDDQMEALSTFKGYQVEASKITVSRFCRSINKMIDHFQKEEIKNKTR